MLILLFLLLLITQNVCADLEHDLSENSCNDWLNESLGPLFVSLGSYCHPAHMLRFCDRRRIGFPFDWITSFDGESLLELLEDDFRYFLDERYLEPFETALLNNYYHLRFLHDGDFSGDNFFKNMPSLRKKYQRRIARFRNLNNYKGKVFFLRFCYRYSVIDPYDYYKFQDNLEITEDYASRLFSSLKQRFPNLDFVLVIVNDQPEKGIRPDKKLSPNILMFRESCDKNVENYCLFLDQLAEGKFFTN